MLLLSRSGLLSFFHVHGHFVNMQLRYRSHTRCNIRLEEITVINPPHVNLSALFKASLNDGVDVPVGNRVVMRVELEDEVVVMLELML